MIVIGRGDDMFRVLLPPIFITAINLSHQKNICLCNLWWCIVHIVAVVAIVGMVFDLYGLFGAMMLLRQVVGVIYYCRSTCNSSLLWLLLFILSHGIRNSIPTECVCA